MKVRWTDVGLLAGVAVGGVALGAPAPVERDTPVTHESLLRGLRSTGLVGADLVDAAIAEVSAAFVFHSVWHLWESPAEALVRGRGWSHQYNTVLADVLEELGFRTRLVHAARVQGWRHPWFFASHTWVKVDIERGWLDACASRSTNRVGRVGFVPVSDELPFRSSTRWTVPLGLVPAVVGGVWRAWLTRRDVPAWIYRRRD